MSYFPIDLAQLSAEVMVVSETRPDVDRQTGAQRLRDGVPVWVVDVLWPAAVDRRPTVETVKIMSARDPQVTVMSPLEVDELMLSTWSVGDRSGHTLQAVIA